MIKSLASAISIGSGGSVGREGPIIQVGAAFGSTLGQVITMPVRQRVLLIAAGAGGGIAATFNTPIGGIVFAVQGHSVLLPKTTSIAAWRDSAKCSNPSTGLKPRRRRSVSAVLRTAASTCGAWPALVRD